MRVALIGLEQSGKKTLFTLLTGRKAPEARKPTDLVEGVASVRDPRVDVLTGICNPESKVYATNNFVLCPDLVVGGSGGRAWLEAARRCDLLCLVVRAFDSDEVYHPTGTVDYARDRSTLEAELALADMELVDTRLAKLAREAKGGQTKAQEAEQKALGKLMAAFEEERPAEDAGLDDEDKEAIAHLGLISFLSRLWVQNAGEDELDKAVGDDELLVSAKIEQEVLEIDDEPSRLELLESMGLTASGLDRMNAAAYKALSLQSFYTIGADEVRAWTIRTGSNAPTAGGKVHSDIERGFIRAEVIAYDDLVSAGSEKAAKDRGVMDVRGKDYVLRDGDICHFLFNV